MVNTEYTIVVYQWQLGCVALAAILGAIALGVAYGRMGVSSKWSERLWADNDYKAQLVDEKTKLWNLTLEIHAQAKAESLASSRERIDTVRRNVC